jgi:hypothetical protein
MGRVEKYKTGLLCGILLFLLAPILQNLFHFKKSIKPLDGAYIEVTDTTLTLQSWLSGRYQERQQEMFRAHFGFHNYYVRLNNQIDFSLFRKSNTERLIVGKGNFLYESSYIEAYFGRDFVGEEKLEEKYKKLKSVQDLLASKGILLEVVMAPGKATFYPEFIPDNWRSEKKLSNYEYCRYLCKKLGITFIDFNAWFLQQKDLSPYDLYPKTGIHWSNYGALLATDSLCKHIEKQSGLNLRDIKIQNVSFSNELRDPDEDLAIDMNLLFNIPTLPMPYASYIWGEENAPVKPKALFIGDSYFWNIYYEGLTNNLFTDCKFWYYNHTVFPESEKERKVKNLNLGEEIKKQQVVVLLATESNIQDIGSGFIEQVYDLYKEDLKDAFRKKVYVKLLSENIKKDKVWLADVERKAKEKNISTEEMITLDAIYIYKTEYCKPGVPELLDETIARIKNTKPWVADIAKKAKEKNVSFEEMMEMDAKYIYDTELKQK